MFNRLMKVLCALSALVVASPASADSRGSGPPLPEMVAPDVAGIDLLNGRRVTIDSHLSIGLADSPNLEIDEGSGAYGGTPMGGFKYTDGAYPYFSHTYVMGNKVETHRDGTYGSGPLSDGSVVSGNVVIEKDGTRWNFASTNTQDPYPTHYLTTIVRPDGETLAYNYSTIPSYGDIRGKLRSIKSSAGYQMNFEWSTYTPAKVTLSNRRFAYCDPLTGSCTGSYTWPTITWSTDASYNMTVTSAGLRSVIYGARQQGAQVGGTSSNPISEFHRQITSGSGVSRTYTGRSSSTSSWPMPMYFGRAYGTSATCVDTSTIWRLQESTGTWTYNYADRCGGVTRTNPLNAQLARSLSNVTDELGRTTSYVFHDAWGTAIDPGVNDIRRVKSITYPEGNKATFEYGEWHGPRNLLSATVTPKPGSSEPTLTWTWSYPAPCDPTTTKYCNKPSYEVDARGKRTDYTYDPGHGGVLTKTLPASPNGVRPQIRYTYQQLSAKVLNASGQLVDEAPIWKLVFTSTCRTQASCAGTADEVVTSYTYDDNLLPITETVRSGDNSVAAITAKTHDEVGNVTSVDGPLAGADDRTVYKYDRLRRLLATMAPDPDGAGALPIPVTRTTYNGDHQPTLIEAGAASAQTDAALSAMTVNRKVATTYDADGRKAKEKTIGSNGATEAVVQYSYDAAGQLQCTTRRMNPALFTSLPSSACTPGTASTNGPDRIAKKVYDAAGQLVQEWQGIATADAAAVATRSYSNNGKLKFLIDANGNRAEMRYDGLDRKVCWLFPSLSRPSAYDPSTPSQALATAGTTNGDCATTGDFEKYGYDAAGNRTSFRKRDGSTLTFSYDDLNRLASKTVPASVSGAAGYNVHYGYDLRGLQTFARFGSPSGQGVTNDYDGFGRLISSTTNMDGVSRTINSQYDAASNRTALTGDAGYSATFSFDALGRLSAYLEGATPAAQFSYDSAGRRSSLGYTPYMASTIAYGYDPVGRLASLTHNLAGGSGDQAATFAHNPASQIVTRTGPNDSYAWTGSVAVNRNYTVNGLNQYTEAGPATFAYDAHGNLTSDGMTSFVYDAENRLVSASNGATLGYDPFGRLWQVAKAGAVTRFLYDGDRLVMEYDGAGNALRSYVHGQGADEPLVWYEASAGWSKRFFHADERGSIVALADSAGEPVAINRYDEYGIPESTNLGRFQYTGQAWLPELGMYYYKARLYSPTLGRFMQTDPIGYKDQINLHAYVGNDPINRFDPHGKETFYIGGSCDGYCSRNTTIVQTYAAGMGTFFRHFQMGALQKAMIAAQKRSEPIIVIGHSLGGSAVRSLVANPKTPRPDLLVTVDPVGDMRAPKGAGNGVGGLWVNITATKDDSSLSFGNRVSNLWGRSDAQDTGSADVQVDSPRIHEDFQGMLEDAHVPSMIKSIEQQKKPPCQYYNKGSPSCS